MPASEHHGQETFTSFIIGEGRLLAECAQILLDQGHAVRGILTRDPLVQGWAAGKGIACLPIEGDLAATLGAQPFDYLFSIINYRILSDDVLAIPKKATINYHDAPLPRYGGVNAVSWALINREKTHGVTWHVVSGRVDAGDILEQRIFPIERDETALTLNTKTFEAAISAFCDLVTDLRQGSLRPIAQNPAERTFNLAGKRPPAAGIIAWDQPASEIEAFVRATDFGPYLNSFGSAKMAVSGEVVVVAQVRVLGDAQQPPGTIVAIAQDTLVVAAADRQIAVCAVTTTAGEALPIARLVSRCGLNVGMRLPLLDREIAAQITAANKAIVRNEPFWATRLQNLAPAVLPHSKGEIRGEYARLPMTLPAEVVEYLRISDNPGETVLAAFGGYLARMGAGAEFDIGFADCQPDLSNIRGLFARFVPFHFEIDLAGDIGQARATVRAELEQIRARGTYLEDAVARHPSLRAGRLVLEVAVALTDDLPTCQPMAGATCTLAIQNKSGECCCIYDTAALSSDAATAMQGQFIHLLRSVAGAPAQRLELQPILTQEEWHCLVVERNQTDKLSPREQPVHVLFEEQVERTPDAVAVAHEGRSLTYAKLNSLSNQLAHYLKRQGIGPESPVALCMERSVEMVVGLLGILKAGGAYVPLDAAYPADRLAFMLEDSEAPVLLTQTHLADRLPVEKTTPLYLDDLAFLEGESGANPNAPVAPDNLAYVIFTSGSTGRPKGVSVLHGPLTAFCQAACHTYGFCASDRVLQFCSISFDASVEEIYPILMTGGTLVLRNECVLDGIVPFLEACDQWRITVLDLPTAYWHEMVSALESGAHALPKSLRTVILGGSAALAQKVMSWQNHVGGSVRLFDTYGLTETTVVASIFEVPSQPDSPETTPGMPIGRLLPNISRYILDSHMSPVPDGVAGELYIGGGCLARGYLNRPELTAEKFVPDPFAAEPGSRLYRTGDLCRYRPDGHIEYLSRIDHMVKIRGFRIELGDIESALLSHGSVQEAAVIDRDDAAGGKSLVAYIVPRNGSIDPAGLRGHLREKLPEYMVPSAFVPLKALPLSPNGKLDRKSLPAPAQSNEEAAYVAPQTQIEEAMAQIWSQVLRRDRVGINDSFFEVGGHSLLATQVISRIRSRFDIDLPMPILFDAPTIAQLSKRVEAAQGEKGSPLPPIVPVPRDRPLPLSFAQQRLWYVSQIDPANPAYNVLYPLRVSGSLDLRALEKAIGMLVERHEALRTRYVEMDGVPAQVVGSGEVSFEVVEVDGQTPAERREAAMRVAEQHFSLPFDLSTGPSLRTVLFPLDAQEHLLALIMHHITSDGWTLALITRELATLYTACAAGERSPLPELAIHYADYAVWQSACMETGILTAQVEYWKRQLEGAPQVAKLPQDRPHPPIRSLSGAVVSAQIDEVDTESLQALCRKESATLFMALLACFNTLLAYSTDERDIVVGTDTTGRDRTELEGLAGCFVNHVVLRTDLSGDPCFTDLLRRVRRVALDAFAHQDVPFDRLVELLRPQRDTAYTPLFQTLFVMQDVPSLAVEEGDLSLEFVPFPATTSKYDLSLFCFRLEQNGRDSVLLQWTYNTDIFDASTIRRLAAQFGTIVSIVASDPDRRLSDIKAEIDQSAAQQESLRQERRQSASYAKFRQMKPRSLK